MSKPIDRLALDMATDLLKEHGFDDLACMLFRAAVSTTMGNDDVPAINANDGPRPFLTSADLRRLFPAPAFVSGDIEHEAAGMAWEWLDARSIPGLRVEIVAGPGEYVEIRMRRGDWLSARRLYWREQLDLRGLPGFGDSVLCDLYLDLCRRELAMPPAR